VGGVIATTTPVLEAAHDVVALLYPPTERSCLGGFAVA